MQSSPAAPAKSITGQRIAAGCAVLFALPFLAVGIGAFFLGTPADTSGFGRYALRIFGAVFALAGVSVIAMAITALRKSSRDAAIVAAAPGQPWRWKSDWAANRCEDQMGKSVAGLWAFGIAWTLVSSFVFVVIPAELAAGRKAVLFALIFPLIGILVLAMAVYHTIRALKFGRSVFELNTNPYVPGRNVSGTVRAKMREVPEGGFDVTLRHIRAVTTGSGKSRSTQEIVEWEQQSPVARGAVAPSAEALRIPVRFDLPEDAQETDDTNASDRRLWRLEVKADVSGVDYAASFELPVFRAEGRSPADPRIAPPTAGSLVS